MASHRVTGHASTALRHASDMHLLAAVRYSKGNKRQKESYTHESREEDRRRPSRLGKAELESEWTAQDTANGDGRTSLFGPCTPCPRRRRHDRLPELFFLEDRRSAGQSVARLVLELACLD